jgi:hypothetical protein
VLTGVGGLSPTGSRSTRAVSTTSTDQAWGPSRFFGGRDWEEAQRRRIAEGGHIAAAGLNGAVTLKSILDRALA